MTQRRYAFINNSALTSDSYRNNHYFPLPTSCFGHPSSVIGHQALSTFPLKSILHIQTKTSARFKDASSIEHIGIFEGKIQVVVIGFIGNVQNSAAY